jgi:hypothetical protein
MSNTADGRPHPLPDELVAALQRASNGALEAIHTLRVAVREHVQNGRVRGATLGEIDAELRTMINIADGDSKRPGYSAARLQELVNQVMKWSEAFYVRRTDGHP